MNYLDRNEFNFEPSELVKETIRNFDIGKLAFYTRIYDEGKKSIFSVFLSELYDIPESQVLLGYGAEDLLKKAAHYFLTMSHLMPVSVINPILKTIILKAIMRDQIRRSRTDSSILQSTHQNATRER